MRIQRSTVVKCMLILTATPGRRCGPFQKKTMILAKNWCHLSAAALQKTQHTWSKRSLSSFLTQIRTHQPLASIFSPQFIRSRFHRVKFSQRQNVARWGDAQLKSSSQWIQTNGSTSNAVFMGSVVDATWYLLILPHDRQFCSSRMAKIGPLWQSSR